MTKPSTNWELVKGIVADALEQPAGLRGGFVREQCDGDESTLAEVNALLAGYESTDGVLGSDADAWVGHHGQDMISLSGQRIGRYTLESLLAEGGMGAVYVARQSSPDRRVALKMLRASLPMLDAAQRFKREAAALGRLRHPNIAQIYESGVFHTEAHSATPYLAMELVDGEPLNTFAVTHRLNRTDRIRLMIKVARAIHAAHQQAVIHRDLKPANVLVQGNGEPKVLDFGIARLADVEEAHTTWQTTVGVLLGTPGYMSPEQAAGDLSQVDVRSDVWSLGVLLYELLTGRLPLEVKGRSIPDFLRAIDTVEARPLGQVDPTLRGDLETIVSTALAKDKTRRYASAEALANDLQNVLDYEPIAARPPSRWYRTGKFVRRNRAAVALASLLVVTMVAATVISTTAFVRERRQRDRAAAVNTFLNDIISQANPYSGGTDTTLRQVMATAENNASRDFQGQPEIEAELRRTIGWTFFQLSDYEAAVRNLRRSVELFEQTQGPDAHATLTSTWRLCSALQWRGRYDEALALAERAAQAAERSLGPDDLLSLELLGTRAAICTDLKQYGRAQEIFKVLIPRMRAVVGNSNERLFSIENNYAYALIQDARYPDAEVILADLVARRSAQVGADHPYVFANRQNLLLARMGQGKYDQCEAEFRALTAAHHRQLGSDHAYTINMDADLADFLNRIGHIDEALALRRSIVDRRRRINGMSNAATLRQEMLLTYPLFAAGEYAEAESVARDALSRARASLGDGHATTALLEEKLAIALSGQRRYSEAEPLFRAALPRIAETCGEKSRWYVSALLYFARCLDAAEQREEALAHLHLALRISLERDFVEEAPRARREIAQVLLGLGRNEQAERALLEAIELDRKLQNPRQLERTTAALADLYDRTGKPSDAARWRSTTQPARVSPGG
jgi:eukaryotic-like serine/threonine-protein kinase